MQTKLNTIEEAIADIKAGKVIIVVDDENRENEGDFLTAAENATPEVINFMATYGRGLICAPLTEERCKELNLDLMVGKNTAAYETNFTVSVDLVGHGCTTGISASDRSKTMLALVNPQTKPEELGRPGHIFPLIAKDGGVIRRAGHTEAGVDLARLAGMKPAGLLVEILKEDGEMARLPDLFKIAEQHQLKIISIEDLIAYRLNIDSLIKREVTIDLPTEWGDFKMTAYTQLDNNATHLAISKGEWKEDEPVLTRVHSSCVTGDIFGSCRCDCGPQLHKSLEMIQKEGKGIVVYMNQEGRGIGLINKLRSYNLQDAGFDTVEANIKLGFKGDERDYGVGAQILRSEGITKMRLMSNNPTKRAGLIGYGLEVIENIPIEIESNVHNERYLRTKRDKMGHSIMKG
ncbi:MULTISPECIES: bifunctional 3,4-dihydroxy-2-butanone-4-phosphate synthase/GTP cyclohydrolase II [unclassified Pedobacter]|uniref:bifunctional 3,4-dihydroxy-2-butanone-4-phosphate synthase/GTP cyclohydrolase II n=1 Tax=Pedobacter TaxID=84567 RepID=UPI000B4BF350|nr:MULTISPECIES: bifunctional 3,4-dihydroxy-2-butanone-4-phosphate synthase/GTP cyclohydrolase II [unclassified Pedobacter]MCX2431548.1 bifunctional 3,4-dihydroxy-2-butanone-4-phosphate synthase/GTP cyclohydrolase II [Pedobacter sp. GR22-10]MCX2584854.1 bifunctional 3,4-dihydroxy-2-butanone-4-phosphate synthase/GTP cyclohydrolase II [Pedobacter sp. MR22-3]OWK71944.1 bifunctional 3,4-dihydroxy-2-butanone-4-phosphate synthase/GTP cyclohydrolase II [Pedobacter sp. AJM]